MNKENKQPKQSICPKCGAEFTCSTATGKCWCMEYKLSADALNQLKQTYPTCLCPSCLAQFAEKVNQDSCRI